MNFPLISHISDVLPHVKDYTEFAVADREWYTVIDYKIDTGDTFKIVEGDEHGSYIRRECRGLIFRNSDGKLIRRAFHKFHNVGQMPETMPSQIDISKPHIVMTKEDGSMVTPLIRDDEVFLATRMGVTDVAKEAMKHINGREQWLKSMVWLGMTPILEYVSPENKIVLQYDKPNLVLTAIRNTFTGRYLDITNFYSPFDLVKIHDSISDFDKFLKERRMDTDREGDVVRFLHNDMMVKLKNDWYVDLHRAKEDIQQDRNVITFIRAGKLDDLIPKLDEKDQKRVRDLETRFWKAVDNVKGRIEGLVMIAKTVYDADKKRIALEFVPNLINKKDSSFIFAAIEGKNISTLIESYIEKNLGSGVKYDELIQWMEN